jgi:hypothetical protein
MGIRPGPGGRCPDLLAVAEAAWRPVVFDSTHPGDTRLPEATVPIVI